MRRVAMLTALLMPAGLDASELAGVENFHQVAQNIYRGAQPTFEGFRALTKIGVKTIVDLRHETSQVQAEKKIVESLGMRFLSVPMTMHAPTDEQVSRVLGELNSSRGPIFVHCQGGRDRTGTVIACYRIAHDGWDSQKALGEAKSDGMRKDTGMKRYVRRFRASPSTADPREPAESAAGPSVTQPF